MTNSQENTAENKEIIGQIADIIKAHDNFLLTTHVRSDPDGISAELSLFHMLTHMGKKAIIVNDSKFPELLLYLLSNEESEPHTTLSQHIFNITEYDQTQNSNFDVVISLDTPNLSRLGKTLDIIPENAVVINIDHHISNERFGTINWVCPDSSSSGEMIYDYFKETGHEITPEIAKALYTSILTDTGCFIHANTSPKCLRIAAELIERGANPSKIASLLYHTNSYGTLKLRSLAIDSLKLEAEGKIAVIQLTNDMIKKAKTNGEVDTQVFSDIPSSIKDVQVGIFLKELENSNDIKVSLRSKEDIDVNKVAGQFGGGGHIRASGCEITGSIDEVQIKIVEAVKKELSNARTSNAKTNQRD
ncbi:MAG: DHH family phosphoesterase [Candidatus Anammoxibacter sp.]